MARRLIVDGYNTIHAWPRLRAVLERSGLEEARRRLVAELGEYAAVRHVDVVVVFDGRRGAGAQPPERVDGVTVVFSGASPNESADHVVERLCADARRAGRAEGVVVATSDRLQRSLVRAMGVDTMSSATLEMEVAAAATDTGAEVSRLDREAGFRGRIEHRLPPEVLARLEALRRGRHAEDAGQGDAPPGPAQERGGAAPPPAGEAGGPAE